jgi:hypothetical protein
MWEVQIEIHLRDSVIFDSHCSWIRAVPLCRVTTIKEGKNVSRPQSVPDNDFSEQETCSTHVVWQQTLSVFVVIACCF